MIVYYLTLSILVPFFTKIFFHLCDFDLFLFILLMSRCSYVGVSLIKWKNTKWNQVNVKNIFSSYCFFFCFVFLNPRSCNSPVVFVACFCEYFNLVKKKKERNETKIHGDSDAVWSECPCFDWTLYSICAMADVPAAFLMQSYCHLLRWRRNTFHLLCAAVSLSYFCQLVFLF